MRLKEKKKFEFIKEMICGTMKLSKKVLGFY